MDQQETANRLIEQKIFTLPDLVTLLACSAVTARRRLHCWRAYTSINRNGRYYALPTVPTFDDLGLWRYQEVCFSAHGNLKRTVAWLVGNTSHGLDSKELGRLVGLSARSSYLSRLRDLPGLSRVWQDGKWLYLAADDGERSKQLAERSRRASQAAGFPTDAEAVDILVCFIRQPALEPEEIAVQLAGQGRAVAAAKIRNLLERHGLQKKKRWSGSPPLP